MEPKLFSSDIITNTFKGNENKDTESPSIDNEDFNHPSKTCYCYSLYKMDQTLKNMQKTWSMID